MFNSSLSSYLKVYLLCWYNFCAYWDYFLHCKSFLFKYKTCSQYNCWSFTSCDYFILCLYYDFSTFWISTIELLIILAILLMELGVVILQLYVFMLFYHFLPSWRTLFTLSIQWNILIMLNRLMHLWVSYYHRTTWCCLIDLSRWFNSIRPIIYNSHLIYIYLPNVFPLYEDIHYQWLDS